MDNSKLAELLESVRAGRISPGEASSLIRGMTYADLGFARVDLHRAQRQGIPEVVLCQGKTPDQVRAIAGQILSAGQTVILTRADPAAYRAIRGLSDDARYFEVARVAAAGPAIRKAARGSILVASAGTADLPVAEEAAVTAQLLGNPVERLYDVGVAGLHRLLDGQELIRRASVVIAVAGMEGALPSVLAGMVRKPVVAVPTSVGYGASFGGLAALLAMLNSCAAGVSVVNIDNGFGAAVVADLINDAEGDTHGR